MAVEDGGRSGRYMIVRPENGGIGDLVRFLVSGDHECCAKFMEGSHEPMLDHAQTNMLGAGGNGGDTDTGGGVMPDHRWVIFVSIIARMIITLLRKPMEWIGYIIEFFLNFFSLNGNLLHLLYNFLRGTVVIPKRGSETFLSAIGHLDGRIDLYKSNLLMQEISEPASGEGSVRLEIRNRAVMDLCMMASKLAYENANVVRNVVNDHWKMHFVDFYNCWNAEQKERSTQVFMLMDKPKDANLILVSFRGTEPFTAVDWSTDIDYSWYEIPKIGRVHMGFLEAMGLGHRTDISTFQETLEGKNKKSSSLNSVDHENTDPSLSSDSLRAAGIVRNELIPALMEEMTAYYTVRTKLKSLLEEHKNAKFVVTGHSLGGALAILFPNVLIVHEEEELMQRLLGVYTFGQPRVGDEKWGKYMEAHLNHPLPKYFRVVYSNDLVPRVPYDDKTFLYKHFGVCLYYDSFYIGQEVDEEPNKNYFGLRYLIPVHVNAVWELLRSLTMGEAEYKESWFSILFRILGLALPGVSSHSPTNYVNSARLGRLNTIQI